jgi:hypothetical protein
VEDYPGERGGNHFAVAYDFAAAAAADGVAVVAVAAGMVTVESLHHKVEGAHLETVE